MGNDEIGERLISDEKYPKNRQLYSIYTINQRQLNDHTSGTNLKEQDT